MKVLVVGSGGREHTIAWKLSKSPMLTELFCAPGNAGTAKIATNVDLQPSNTGALAIWALENKIDLTVVGPEAPLADGLVDIFNEHGLSVFGPTKAAARLESSKSFAKEVMQKAGVKTPTAEIFEEFEKAKEYVLAQGAPIVIKADGLASGKGVTVAFSTDEAIAALEEAMVGKRFGDSGVRVVVEEYIDGKEASVMALVDGTTVLPLVVSQDYKRHGEGDQGPNTGGMGAISPTPVLDEQRVESLVAEIFIPVLQELWSQGIKYVGFLYAGVIVDSEHNAKVLEFNVRLGDPETQVLLPRLESDLLPALDAAVRGQLASVDLRWKKEAAATVVASSRGYPGKCDDGKEITGLFEERDKQVIFYAGAVNDSQNPEKIISKGGRILAVTGLGSDTNEALKNAYAGLSEIQFDGLYSRKDIGGGVKE